MRTRSLILLVILVASAIGAAALVLGESGGAVDWRRMRAVAIESDDWGLQGFVPGAGAWAGVDRAAIAPGSFPEVYWQSTLEDSAAVADLCAVLASHRGRDGLPAVFQPNYVMSGMGWRPDHAEGLWHRFDLPDLDPHYRRPGLWHAVGLGIQAGVWYPEFHAAFHYDPQRRLESALEGPHPRRATERGIMLFPGSEKARELGPWRSQKELGAELDHSLVVFSHLFGRLPDSIIAPDYTWSARNETIWSERNLRIIQGKREQRNPQWGGGTKGRLAKLLERSFDRVRHPDRAYLERNCRLEPAQARDAKQVVQDCLAATRRAWARGEPAIVETHRVNFVHTDPAVEATGREALDSYLAAITRDPDTAPLFLVDREIAGLQRGGTSWCVRGTGVVVRNGSRSRRLVLVPADASALVARQLGVIAPSVQPILLALSAGETRFLPLEELTAPRRPGTEGF